MKITDGPSLELIKSAGKKIEQKAGKGVGDGGEAKPLEKGEKVDISLEARELLKAKKSLDGLPEVRVEKVEQIKKALQDGTIKTDSMELAEKIIKEHLLDDIL